MGYLGLAELRSELLQGLGCITSERDQDSLAPGSVRSDQKRETTQQLGQGEFNIKNY